MIKLKFMTFGIKKINLVYFHEKSRKFRCVEKFQACSIHFEEK